MKTKPIILLILMQICVPLFASYPDLTTQSMPELHLPDFEQKQLEAFLSVWSPPQGPSLQALVPTL